VPQAWTDPLVRPNQWKMELRFCTWNVRSLYRSSLLTIVSRELARYKLDLVGVQVVRWEKGSIVRVGNYIFLMEKEKKIINWEQDILYTSE